MEKTANKQKMHGGKIALYVIAILWTVVTLFPVVVTVMASFKTNSEIYLNLLSLPKKLMFQNYISANKTADALNTIKNSLVVATLTTVFNTVVGMMAAYILSRKDYKFLKWVYVFFMIGVMVPVHCTLIPINNIATALNAKNNLFFLILIYVAFGMSQAIFLYTGFMDGISRNLDEAAIIDGCNNWQLLWKINLYIAGTANVPLFSQKTIFKNDLMDKIIPDALVPYSTLIIILVLAVICKVLLDLYLNTKSGFLLRAVGDNDVLVVSLAKDKGNIKILGLAISNGLVALAGCVFAQEERVFEISMGTGAMVIGLASVIIGTSIFRKLTLLRTTTAVLIGSIIYKACVAIALRNFDPQAMKLVTAVLFLIVLIISMERKKKVNTNA